MSQDTPSPPASDPEAARQLGRWLDRPGQAPPDVLEDDVVQAMYALRPDLAPPPRVSAEEILASVTRGPLAVASGAVTPGSLSRDGAEIVRFPGGDPSSGADPTQETEVGAVDARATIGSRSVVWAGGLGGAGIMLVAAAVLLVVALPPSADLDTVAMQAESTSDAISPASAPPHKVELSDQIAEAQLAAPPPSESGGLDAPSAAVQTAKATGPAAVGAARSNLGQDGDEGIRIEDRKGFDPQPAFIPEVGAEPVDLAAQGTPAPQSREAPLAEAAAAAIQHDDVGSRASAPAASNEPVERGLDRYAPRGRAETDEGVSERPALSPPSSDAWRTTASDAVVTEVDALLARAGTLEADHDLAAAAALLASSLRGPAPVAHHLARRAAELYLQAGNPVAAEAIATRGLAYARGDQAARAWLWLLRGDAALARGDAAAAAEAWSNAR